MHNAKEVSAYLPGKYLAISAHRLPSCLWRW